ncbi:MAG: protein kinase [Vicinamibacterales bacterium]
MTPERWKQIEGLYQAAHGRPPGERAGFLAAACPDDEALRDEVESLLNEPLIDDGFLAAPALVLPAHMVAELMPKVMTGRSLGGYQLQRLLGAGGMGEVYRAHDAKLQRDIAIKILPHAFTSDQDRLARFEREARMLAALNHPNICAIYGLEEADGVRFLVLELVEGEMLATKIANVSKLRSQSSGLPLDEALAIARQIVDALEIAHDRGIVHRDLKPANITITPAGVVKVLDFGLAKNVGGDGSAPELTHAPVVTESGRREGPVVGTAAYMSPEQARGLAVDKRTDIWAFGCVLYEMLTGRVMFAGDTVSDSIAKILEREPEWSALPAATPAPIRRLLLRCLAKDPKQRLRDIGDARIEIDALDEVARGTAAARGGSRAPARIPTTWLPWVALLALAAGVGVWEATRPVPTENPLANARFTPLTNWEGTEEGAEISPDGRFVVFLADREGEFDLWWSQVGTGEFKNLTPDIPKLDAPGILWTAGFSGDGADVWFGRVGETLLRMPQTGGAPRPFLGPDAKAPAWSADGNLLVYFTQTKDGDLLSVADRTGGDARRIEINTSEVTKASGIADTVHNHNPAWSPDNQWIYFVHGFVREWNQKDEMDIWRISPSGGSPERLTYLNTAVTFLTALDPRTLLYIAREEDGSGPWLWALDVPSKVARRVTSGLEQYTSVAASRDGRRVVATKANPTSSLWTVPILDRPAEDSAAQPYGVRTVPALAPRFGGTSLFYLSARGADDGLWGFKEGKSFEILKSADGPLFEPPAPSPDGLRVAVVRKRDGKHRLTVMSANGTESRTLAPSIDVYGTADWSPDSTRIVTGGKDAEGLAGLFMIPVDGGRAGDPMRIADGVAINPVWSPDGSVIVYAGPFAKGQVPLFGVRPDRTPVELPPVRVRPGGYRFLRNGAGLVYLPRPESLDFWLLDLVTKRSRQLTRLSNRGTIRGFDITPDGKQILFDRSRQNSDIVLIDLPKN